MRRSVRTRTTGTAGKATADRHVAHVAAQPPGAPSPQPRRHTAITKSDTNAAAIAYSSQTSSAKRRTEPRKRLRQMASNATRITVSVRAIVPPSTCHRVDKKSRAPEGVEKASKCEVVGSQ